MYELHQAVMDNRADRVAELLAEGSVTDINLLDESDATALHYAAGLGFPACADVLLNYGARKDIGGLFANITPLQLVLVSAFPGFPSELEFSHGNDYPATIRVFIDHLTWVERINLKIPTDRAMGA